MDHKMSEKIDEAYIRGIYLTLATWQPNPEFSKSYEIGWRRGDEFHLIQWDGVSSRVAWDVTKRLAAKGRYPSDIRKVLDRIGNR